MRRSIPISLCALAAALVLVPVASADFSDAGVRDTYTCDPTYDMYTACAVIKNDTLVWADSPAGGGWVRSRPLVFAGLTAVYAGNASSVGAQTNKDQPYGWLAQRKIAGTESGEALVSGVGNLNADGAFLYSLRQVNAPENYQAVVGFRVSSSTDFNRCLVSNYLACEKSGQLESGRDSKFKFTVTTRPLEVRIQNAMSQDLIRDDGPYLTNGMRSSVADSTVRIDANSGVGRTGVLRSINKTTIWSAVYRFARSTTDTRYNGSMLLVNIKIGKDGAETGTCTPLFPPSGTRFSCTIEDSGTATGIKYATVRVSPN